MAYTGRRPLLYTSAAMKEQGKRGGSEAQGRGQENGTARKSSGLTVWSWVFYDFSNTIFSISILSYFFPLWLGDELGAGADTFNYLVALSALLVVLTAPVPGLGRAPPRGGGA